MDRQNIEHVQRQIDQLVGFGSLTKSCRDELFSDLDKLDAALESAEDVLDIIVKLRDLGFDSIHSDESRKIIMVLPSCGGLPVDFSVPKNDNDPIKYANRRKFLGL